MLYLIFLLLLPVSRTSPTSRTSLDRPVFSSASCSSTVRNLQTDPRKDANNELSAETGASTGSLYPPSHLFGSRSSSFAAAPAKTQIKSTVASFLRSICGKSCVGGEFWSQRFPHSPHRQPPRPEQPMTDGRTPARPHSRNKKKRTHGKSKPIFKYLPTDFVEKYICLAWWFYEEDEGKQLFNNFFKDWTPFPPI